MLFIINQFGGNKGVSYVLVFLLTKNNFSLFLKFLQFFNETSTFFYANIIIIGHYAFMCEWIVKLSWSSIRMLARAGAFMIFVEEYPTTSLILIKTKMKYTETHQIQSIKPLLIVKNMLFSVYNRKKVIFIALYCFSQ